MFSKMMTLPATRPTSTTAIRPATSRARSETPCSRPTLARSGSAAGGVSDIASSRSRDAQAVPGAADRMDQRRTLHVDLLPQIADVGLDHIGVAAEVVLPHVVE